MLTGSLTATFVKKSDFWDFRHVETDPTTDFKTDAMTDLSYDQPHIWHHNQPHDWP